MTSVSSPVPQPCSSLQLRIQSPFPAEHLLTEYWNLSPSIYNLNQLSEVCTSYISYYVRRCEQLSPNRLGKLRHHDNAQAFSLVLSKATKKECLAKLQQSASNPFVDDAVNAASFAQEWLNFVSQSLLLIDAQNWQDDRCFEDYFKQVRFAPSHEETRASLNKQFHIQNLQRIGGIQIYWTDMLSEHLALDEDNGILSVFKHLDALALLKARNLIDDDFVNETKRTYCILFPYVNPAVEKWFEKERLLHNLSRSLMPNRSLGSDERRLKLFQVWRDRLLILKEYYDHHEPSGLREKIFDDRKPARRWAFAVAVMVFILTLAQVVGTVLQVYKAFKPSPSPP